MTSRPTTGPAAGPSSRPPVGPATGGALALAGIVALAFNLRPAAVSVGPVLAEVRDSLSMSAASAGLLTSLPVLAFAAFGALAPAAARRVGNHRLILLALLGVVAGLGGRALVGATPGFLVLSVLALSGMATANVLLPTLVKSHFPDRVGVVTGAYTTALAVGLTAASALTVPLADALGSWRWGLGAWAVLAAVCVVPWLPLARRELPVAGPDASGSSRTIRLEQVARTRLGWAMALTFGLQSLLAYSIFGWFAQVYRDAGFSADTAGYLLGVITAVSIPVSFVLPTLAGRLHDHTWLMLGIIACYPVGFVGLVVAPVGGAWVWALLVGLGTGIFPLVLAQIGLRARTPEGTAALSGFAQPVGYLVAAVGPVGLGLLHDGSGDWTLPLLVLTGVSVLLALVALVVARPRHLEDEL